MEYNIHVKCIRVERGALDPGHVGPWVARPYPAFVLTRAGEMSTEYRPEDGGKHLRRGQGRVVWYPANRRRRVCTPSHEGAEYTAVVLSFAIFPGVDLLDFLEFPQLLPKNQTAPIAEILEQLATLASLGEESQSLQSSVHRQELCCRLLRHVLDIAPLPEDAALRLGGWPRLAPALEYLDRHFHQPFRIPELAALVSLSVVQFHRRFRALTGTSPLEYAKRLRLQLAATLLVDTELSVTEIGDRVGWADPFHFSKVFSAAHGIPPTEYRRRGGSLV